MVAVKTDEVNRGANAADGRFIIPGGVEIPKSPEKPVLTGI
jgi:hypothetical protein